MPPKNTIHQHYDNSQQFNSNGKQGELKMSLDVYWPGMSSVYDYIEDDLKAELTAVAQKMAEAATQLLWRYDQLEDLRVVAHMLRGVAYTLVVMPDARRSDVSRGDWLYAIAHHIQDLHDKLLRTTGTDHTVYLETLEYELQQLATALYTSNNDNERNSQHAAEVNKARTLLHEFQGKFRG